MRFACATGKRGFDSLTDALSALAEAQVEKVRRSHRAEKRVYQCRVCGNYHLTSKKFWRR